MNKFENLFQKKKSLSIIIAGLLLCVVGFFIHSIRIMYYFPNMANVSFNLPMCLITALVWLASLGLLYAIFKYFDDETWIVRLRNIPWRKTLKYVLY